MSVVVFGLFAGLALLGAVGAAAAPRIVHAAIALLLSFVGVAGLYGVLGADFVALCQVLIYVGGILVLLVFGVLLTSRVRGVLGVERPRRPWWAIATGEVLLLGLLLALSGTEWKTRDLPAEPEPTTAAIGRAFLEPERSLVPFELASVLLLAALVGAAYLARRRRAS